MRFRWKLKRMSWENLEHTNFIMWTKSQTSDPCVRSYPDFDVSAVITTSNRYQGWGKKKWTAPEINRTTHRSKRKNMFNTATRRPVRAHAPLRWHFATSSIRIQQLKQENERKNGFVVPWQPQGVNGCRVLHRNKTKQISCIVLTTGSCKIGSTTLTSNRFLLCSVIGICHYSVVLKERTQDCRGRANAR